MNTMSAQQAEEEEQKIKAKLEEESRMKELKHNMAKEMVKRKNERIQEEQADLHSTLKRVLAEVQEANLSA